LKKFLLFFAVPFLVLNGFFVAKMNDYPELQRFADHPAIATISAVFVLFFALPSFWSLVKWLGPRRGGLALVALGAFAIGIETFAVITGYPYGQFSYGNKIGDKLFGVTPWTVPFAWTPLMLGAYAIARRNIRGGASVIIGAALITVVLDATLDPGAVSQKFWTYRYPGVYYGVSSGRLRGLDSSGPDWGRNLQAFAGHDQDSPVGASHQHVADSGYFGGSVCACSALWIPAFTA
jgi:putative membrane protein